MEAGRPSDASRPLERLYWTLAVSGLVVSTVLAWMPLESLVTHYVIDDAFYYLTAARNLMAGGGATLDGHHPTNGFHPLWLGIVWAALLVTGSRAVLALHLALTAAVLLLALTVGLVYACLRRMSHPLVASAAAALLGFNYRLATLPLGGMETALAGALAMAVTATYALHGGPDTPMAAIRRGVLLGLAALARFDLLALASCVLLWSVFERRSQAFGRRLALAAVSAATLLAMLVPWVLFSLGAAQALLPRSGEAIRAAGSPWDHATSLGSGLRVLGSVLAVPSNDLCNILGLSPWVHPLGPSPVGEGLLASALVLVACFAWKSSPSAQRLSWIPVWCLLHAAYYVQFGFVRVRYLYPLVAPFVVFAAVVAWGSLRGASQGVRRAACVLPLVLLVVTSLAGLDAYQRCLGDYIFQGLGQSLLAGTRWIGRNTPEDAVVGAFNAGMVSYLSGRTTVNLDGCMNTSALEAIEQKRLGEYVRDARITYLVDYELPLTEFMDAFSGESGWRGEYRPVFSVRGSYFGGARHQRLVVLQRKGPS